MIGSSAGGVEALSVLVTSLVTPFPAPIVVAQHLDPRHGSHLGEILSRRTTLAVQTVDDRAALQAGVLYLVPADRHVEITAGEVILHRANGKGPKPSVDRLLRSAAQTFREGCVAVILTGSGSDGTAGAAAVKAAGGFVVIQNPATAKYPSMPRSLAPTSVDLVCDLEEMGDRLYRLVSTEPVAAEHDLDEIDRLLDRLRVTDGIDFSAYKRPTILRRLQSRLVATGQQHVDRYGALIEVDRAERQRLVRSFLIGVTSFFRDPAVMGHLRTTVLPDLLAAARETGELRLWSAGCATGEEAYSLAILVAELQAKAVQQVDVRIFATDVDDEALAFGRRGVYARAALDKVSAAQRRAHFTETDREFEVSKAIRAMVVFGQHDLGARAPFPRIDLVLCRNVLIYFTKELQERALSVFAYSLRPGGRLVLGPSETVGSLAEAFDAEDTRLKVFRRRPEPRLLLGARAPTMRTPVGLGSTSLQRSIASTRGERERRRLSLEHADQILSELPIGIVVVDGRYETLRINAAARRLLAIHGPALGSDFVHLTDVIPGNELRSAIKGAVAGRTTVGVYQLPSPDLPVGALRSVQLVTVPHRAAADSPVEGALLMITDVSEAEADRRAASDLSAQFDDLNEQRRRLAEANGELTGANDRLRVANEDFLFDAEEAQSSREEMETMAEELQATNEELETLNEELQATNEELETANEDLATRSAELAEQREDLAKGRDRLASVLDGMSDALLVVDRDGRPVITNTTYDAIFGGPGDTLIPEDEDGRALPRSAWPAERAREGEDFRMQFSLAARDRDGTDDGRRWYEATGHGLHIADERWAGVVVTRDITDRSLRRLEEQFMATASHELRTPLAALHGYVQLLVRRLDGATGDDARAAGYASSALLQTRNLTVLVDRLFDLGRLSVDRFDLERSVIDLAALARRVVDVAAVLQQGSTFTVHAPRTAVMIDADAGRIEQVLLGVLTNSIDHGAADRIDVRVRRVHGQAELSVTDDGRGISVAQQADLFDRRVRVGEGSRTSKAGLGLGLYLARQIIQAHGGTVALVSAPGEGTTVTMRLHTVSETTSHVAGT